MKKTVLFLIISVFVSGCLNQSSANEVTSFKSSGEGDCPDGEYRNLNLQCRQCPPGTAGKEGKCIPCEGNTFNQEFGATSCDACEAPFLLNSAKSACSGACDESGECYNPLRGECEGFEPWLYKDEIGVCQVCPLGRVATQNRQGCEPCPFGKPYNSSTKNCSECANNEILNWETNTCVLCPAGILVNGACVACAADEKPNERKDACVFNPLNDGCFLKEELDRFGKALCFCNTPTLRTQVIDPAPNATCTQTCIDHFPECKRCPRGSTLQPDGTCAPNCLFGGPNRPVCPIE